MMKRRTLLLAATAGGALGTALTVSTSAAAKLRKTGSDAEGPFYPVVPIPLDTNLLISADHGGEPLTFSGRVLGVDGSVRSNARIEIWQCDAKGVYEHPSAPDRDTFDSNFRGFGATLTDSAGAFSFQTIVPVRYTGRPPHIHVKVFDGDREVLTTQIYLHGKRGPDSRKIKPEVASDHYAASFDFVI